MQILSNKKFISAGGAILLVLIVGVITFLFLSKPKYPFDTILVTTGGSLRISGFDGFIIPVAEEDKGKEYNLPTNTKVASQNGWYKISDCIDGEGIYYGNIEETSIKLIFDASENLIGIYQHSLQEMAEPWVITKGPQTNDKSFIIENEHYGSYIFLLNPAKACSSDNDYESKLVSNTTLPSYSIPIDSNIAISNGWIDPFFCSPGRGKYFQKDGSNHVLMYNANGKIIGIYQYTLNLMPSPWFKTEKLIGGGSVPIIDFEHHGFFIYFEDPMNACQSSDSKSVGTGGTHYAGPKAERSEYGPTPTPTVILSIADTIDQLSNNMSTDSRVFKINGQDGVSSAKISKFISSITNIQEGTSKWIDNVSNRGLAGEINQQGMKHIIDEEQSGVLTVNIWVDKENNINLIEITGTITYKDTEPTKLTILAE